MYGQTVETGPGAEHLRTQSLPPDPAPVPALEVA